MTHSIISHHSPNTAINADRQLTNNQNNGCDVQAVLGATIRACDSFVSAVLHYARDEASSGCKCEVPGDVSAAMTNYRSVVDRLANRHEPSCDTGLSRSEIECLESTITQMFRSAQAVLLFKWKLWQVLEQVNANYVSANAEMMMMMMRNRCSTSCHSATIAATTISKPLSP